MSSSNFFILILFVSILAQTIVNVRSQNQVFSAYPVAGCYQEKEFNAVRFNKDCRSDKSDGYFKFPTTNTFRCNVTSDRFIEQVKTSGRSSFNLAIPVPKINSPNHAAFIEVNAVDKGIKTYDCNKDADEFFLNALLDKKEKSLLLYDRFLDYGDQQYKIEGLPATEIGYASVIDGDFKVHHLHKKDDPNKKHDIYYKMNADRNMEYMFQCFPWNNVCHSSKIEILDGRLTYQVSFSIDDIDHVFDIVPAASAFLEKSYTKDRRR